MIGAALNIVLNYVFIKMFGYVAAGYTTFVCYLVYCIGHYIFVEHIIKKKFGRHLIDWKIPCNTICSFSCTHDSYEFDL